MTFVCTCLCEVSVSKLPSQTAQEARDYRVLGTVMQSQTGRGSMRSPLGLTNSQMPEESGEGD